MPEAAGRAASSASVVTISFLSARFKETGEGFPEADFQGYVEAIAGGSLDSFFARYVRGTDELDYEGLKLSLCRPCLLSSVPSRLWGSCPKCCCFCPSSRTKGRPRP